MLTTRKIITYTGESKIDGVTAENYQANIDSNNPEDMTISSWQSNKSLYKANRTTCRKDSAEFEDMVYAVQDEMIAVLETEAETETETNDRTN